jgi:hypothetical protein
MFLSFTISSICGFINVFVFWKQIIYDFLTRFKKLQRNNFKQTRNKIIF